MQELRRQWFHLCFGIAMMLVGLLWGKDALVGALVSLLVAGLVLIHLLMTEARLKSVEMFLEKLDRPKTCRGKAR